MKKMKLAFTLAEVIIVLGIVGILAEMVIPMLIANVETQKRIAGVKEIYSILSQATAQIRNDNGGTLTGLCNGLGNYNAASTLCVSNLYAPYLKYTKKCDSAPTTNGCWGGPTTYNLDKTVWWNGDHPIITAAMVLQNGMTVSFYKDSDLGSFGFDIDINGPTKGIPTNGVDIFLFMTTNDRLIPFQNGTTCSGVGNGCTGYYLMQ